MGQKKLKRRQINRQPNDLFKGQRREASQILILGAGKTEVSQTESKRNIKAENDSVSDTCSLTERKRLKTFLLFYC